MSAGLDWSLGRSTQLKLSVPVNFRLCEGFFFFVLTIRSTSTYATQVINLPFIQEAAQTGGHAAEMGEEAKHSRKDEACALREWSCILLVEVFGGWAMMDSQPSPKKSSHSAM